ncbi:FtsX-like permease family protein [Spirosoma sp. HMF4905]|uniref:FtsX-like permease family protein n=2 Tax=Spirosoma arboris TaxID=2682092 RepID=A0A7K1SJL8_9BACT|nr:FtsX-like permease family protein [Spirosoma arboris]
MIRNYVKTAWRHLAKNKFYTLINIAGLTLGLICSLFIMVWVADETSYDRFHQDSGQLYQVWRNFTTDGKIDTWTSLPERVAEALQTGYPEVEDVAASMLDQQFIVTSGNTNFREKGGYASPGFFRIFSFPFLQGNPQTALQSPGNVVISASTAARLFGADWRAGRPLIGKTITVDHNRQCTITGVVRDVPQNSTLQFDVVLPIAAWIQQDEDRYRSWGYMSCAIYAKLQKDASLPAFNAKVADIMAKAGWEGTQLFLQRFGDIYLHGTYKNGQLAGGRIDYVNIFLAAGVFLLVIACINFMNLATARSSQRAREIGVRKTMGAQRVSLIVQFILESTAMAFIAFLLALALMVALLPFFDDLTGKKIALNNLNAGFLLGMMGTSLIVGVVSGSYPALYLSSFRPVIVLKGSLSKQQGTVSIRQGLVVFQFMLSILLIVSTIVVYQQLTYIRTINLGLDRANLLYVPQEGALKDNAEALMQELGKQPGIESVTTSGNNPLGKSTNTLAVGWRGKPADNKQLFYIIFGNYDFVKTMHMQLAAGRDFTRDFGADSLNFILNEEAARMMGKDVLGKRIEVYGKQGQVVGIVKNFSMTSLYSPTVPAIIPLAPTSTRYLFVRTEPGKTKEALTSLAKVCQDFNPGYPFDYSFVDQEFEQAYRTESVMGTLANLFALIALFISCLGLFGLAAFTAEQRTKEIGVRKVLGASVTNIVGLLSKGFLKPVLVAIGLASPIAWWAMNQWLQDFAYRITIEWWVFVLAGLVAVGIAVLTVSFQSIKAALVNPVKSLRSE